MRPSGQVVLLSVDGLRPDALPLAATPEIDALLARGAHTLAAQAVMPSITLPCHVSMLYGVPAERHGVVSNVWQPAEPPIPSLIDLAHGAGLSTAAFYTWEELRDLGRPGALDVAYYRREDPEAESMLDVARAAAACIAERRPALTFVYLEAPDTLGHREGWMSERYLWSVNKVDRAIGLLTGALRSAGRLDETLFLLTADHGGHGRGHGSDRPEDMTVPWIVAGPGVGRGRRITSSLSIVDTAPTLAHLMGLAIPAEWEGRVAEEALAR
jgi:predicted AlkP superfamily pyrophosphatase or phosphodiesterase